MVKERNSINRLVAEVRVPSVAEAGLAQSDYSAFIRSELLPLVEKVAQKLNLPGRLIRIDKLVLDFGNFDPKGSNLKALRAFEDQIEEKLARIIQKEIHPLQAVKAPAGQPTDLFDEKSVIEHWQNGLPDEELLLFILREGYLPWWASSEENVRLEDLAQAVLNQPSVHFKNTLAYLIKLATVRSRIAFRLSVRTIEKIIQLVSPFSEETFKSIDVLLDEIKLPHVQSIKLHRFLFERSLQYFNQVLSSDLLLNKLLNNDPPANPLPLDLRKAAEHIQEFHQDTLPSFKGGVNGKTNNGTKPEKNKDIVEMNPGVDETVEKDALISSTGNDGKYFITNAGLVIACHYLPVFFEALGLIRDKQFVSREATERAVQLLQYMATGSREEFEEHDLLFNKILCGLQPDRVLVSDFEITDAEENECKNLLQAIASNWTALGNTSAEGMRDAFFMRNGILEQQANGWNLKIEKNAIDVLVDRLPWSISIIKLPWCEGIIFIDW